MKLSETKRKEEEEEEDEQCTETGYAGTTCHKIQEKLKDTHTHTLLEEQVGAKVAINVASKKKVIEIRTFQKKRKKEKS